MLVFPWRPPPTRIGPEVVDWIPAERAGVLAAGLEPLVQAGAVEEVPACPTAPVRHFLVRGDDGVADCTLGLPFEGANHVSPKREETVDDAAVLSHYAF